MGPHWQHAASLRKLSAPAPELQDVPAVVGADQQLQVTPKQSRGEANFWEERVLYGQGKATGEGWTLPVTPAFSFSLFFCCFPFAQDFEGVGGGKRIGPVSTLTHLESRESGGTEMLGKGDGGRQGCWIVD